MEEKLLVIDGNDRFEIIGESLFDCIDVAYRRFKGKSVELQWIQTIGDISGDELFIHERYLDRYSVHEIMDQN